MSMMIDEIADSEILNSLNKLGLSPKEALVYTALLPLGQVGSSKIIKNTGLHGQFVYQALDGLEKKGLVQHVIQSGRKKFNANPPERIQNLIEDKKQIAEDAIQKLNRMAKAPALQQFEIFQGKEAYVAHEFDQLEKATAGSELALIGGGEGPDGKKMQGDQFLTAMGSRMDEYERLREKKGIRIRYIGGENQRMNLFWYKNNRKLFEYKLLPGFMSGLVNTDIWEDTINLNMFSYSIIAFSIKNEKLAKSYWDFFETLWKIARG